MLEQAADTAQEVEKSGRKPWLKILLVAIFAAGLIAVLLSGVGPQDAFDWLRSREDMVKNFIAQNYLSAAMLFVLVYVLATAFSIPGAIWLTIAGGFLFGTIWSTVYVALGATIGAVAIFLAARYIGRDAWARRAGPAMKRMEGGFRENALSYLLFLRLVPVFPFWIVNLVPALLGVKLRTYFIGTFFGIIPGAAVYSSVGAGLSAVLEAGGSPDLSIIFAPEILGPILALAALAMLPVALKKFAKRKDKQ